MEAVDRRQSHDLEDPGDIFTTTDHLAPSLRASPGAHVMRLGALKTYLPAKSVRETGAARVAAFLDLLRGLAYTSGAQEARKRWGVAKR
jgi:hypothetical protein